MKVSISFKPEEADRAKVLAQMLKAALEPARIKTTQKDSFEHIYISTKQNSR